MIKQVEIKGEYITIEKIGVSTIYIENIDDEIEVGLEEFKEIIEISLVVLKLFKEGKDSIKKLNGEFISVKKTDEKFWSMLSSGGKMGLELIEVEEIVEIGSIMLGFFKENK